MFTQKEKYLFWSVLCMGLGAIVLILWSANAHAGTYKIVKDGKVFYSDTVPDGAQSVKLLKAVPVVNDNSLPLYWPQPSPIHYESTGAVCFRGWGEPWQCQAGRPADKTETNVTVNSGGGFPLGLLGRGRVGRVGKRK